MRRESAKGEGSREENTTRDSAWLFEAKCGTKTRRTRKGEDATFPIFFAAAFRPLRISAAHFSIAGTAARVTIR
jgi:hypothetical protein